MVTEFISPDGAVEDPGGAEAAAAADWTAFDRGVEGDQLKLAELEAADVRRLIYDLRPHALDELYDTKKVNARPQLPHLQTPGPPRYRSGNVLA